MGRGLRIGYTLGPQLGAHGSDFDLHLEGTTPARVGLTTQTAGGSIIVGALGELANLATPTDSKSNTYAQLETSGYHGGAYTGFGLSLFGKAGAAGGSSHNVDVVKSYAAQESTLIVVEVKGGATIQDSSIVTRAGAGAGVAYTSAAVTVTGPAVLVAFWGGDGNELTPDQSVAAENGWTMVESLFLGLTAYIQAACAVKRVTSAGDYTCSWTPVANQGAILGLVAVQA